MRTDGKLLSGQIAIPTEELESFLGPSSVLEIAVKGCARTDLASVLLPIIVDMIDGEKMPVGFPAANTLPAVGNNCFLSKRAPSLLQFSVSAFSAGRACLFVLCGWLLATDKTNAVGKKTAFSLFKELSFFSPTSIAFLMLGRDWFTASKTTILGQTSVAVTFVVGFLVCHCILIIPEITVWRQS